MTILCIYAKPKNETNTLVGFTNIPKRPNISCMTIKVQFRVMITIKVYITLYTCVVYCTVVVIISTCNINFSLTCYHIFPEFTDIVELIIRMAILHLKHNTYTNYVIQNNFMIE